MRIVQGNNRKQLLDMILTPSRARLSKRGQLLKGLPGFQVLRQAMGRLWPNTPYICGKLCPWCFDN